MPVISAFILWNVLAIGTHLYAPLLGQQVCQAAAAPFDSYVKYFGLWQTFSLFVRNRHDMNRKLSVVLNYTDGSTAKFLVAPKPQDVWERLRLSRWREFAGRTSDYQDHSIWETEAIRFFATKYGDETKDLSAVALYRIPGVIPAPKGVADPAWVSALPCQAELLCEGRKKP